MNRKCLEDCDFCGITYGMDKEIKHGVDMLRPFNPSFEPFFGVHKDYGSYVHEKQWADTIICKVCAEKIAQFIMTSLMRKAK